MSEAQGGPESAPRRIFAFAGQDLLVPADGTSASLEAASLEGLGTLRRKSYQWDGRSCAALALDDAQAEAALATGLMRLHLRQAMGSMDGTEARAALKGLALLNWLSGAVHCGACGAMLAEPAPGGDAQASGGLVCPDCGRTHFPRISPAVIVLVRKGAKALLARNARFPAGRFGLLAGFVEAGEGLEEAAAREVREEAGIEIGNLRYRYSQPWPFPDSLMVAFEAEWTGGEARPDGEEIVELRWCAKDELPQVPPTGSVARRLIDDFAAS